ncbi:MAG: hypothetical protein CMN78_00655 [Spirochaetales bacterium]|nr:hypothetical protein [Spirochaetales bacterium]
MENQLLLFLDFDGVICDSIDECFVSSWYALFGGATDSSQSVSLSAHRQFVRYRPFIRRGADYLLLQHCIDGGIVLASQADFDRQERLTGTETMDAYHRKFYAARAYFLQNSSEYWLGLNRIYPGLAAVLPDVANDGWILTTKEADFAHRILCSQGLAWDRGRIICTGKERKLDIIQNIMESEKAVHGIFIDDQIDHFSGLVYPKISCMLASWGYIKTEWLNGKVETISLNSCIDLLRGLF